MRWHSIFEQKKKKLGGFNVHDMPKFCRRVGEGLSDQGVSDMSGRHESGPTPAPSYAPGRTEDARRIWTMTRRKKMGYANGGSLKSKPLSRLLKIVTQR